MRGLLPARGLNEPCKVARPLTPSYPRVMLLHRRECCCNRLQYRSGRCDCRIKLLAALLMRGPGTCYVPKVHTYLYIRQKKFCSTVGPPSRLTVTTDSHVATSYRKAAEWPLTEAVSGCS